MYSYSKILKEAKRAVNDDNYLTDLIILHEEISKDINKTMLSMKRHGHVMGSDLSNKFILDIYEPFAAGIRKDTREYKSVKKLKTIRLDHRITMKYLLGTRKMIHQLHSEHLDYDFAKLALQCRRMINTSRILKQIELSKGTIFRKVIFAIKRNHDKIEFY